MKEWRRFICVAFLFLNLPRALFPPFPYSAFIFLLRPSFSFSLQQISPSSPPPPPHLSVEGDHRDNKLSLCCMENAHTNRGRWMEMVKWTFLCKQINNRVLCYSPWHLLYPPHTQSLTPSVCFHFFCHIWILKRSKRVHRNAVKEQKTQTRGSWLLSSFFSTVSFLVYCLGQSVQQAQGWGKRQKRTEELK